MIVLDFWGEATLGLIIFVAGICLLWWLDKGEPR